MRTTITLDADVAQQVKALMARMDRPFRAVVNDALRRGLGELRQPHRPKRYRMKPHRMGLRHGLNLDNIQALLTQVEGEDAR